MSNAGQRLGTSPTDLIETAARRQRAVVIAGLVLVCGLTWAFVLAGAGTGMSIAAMSTWQFPPPMGRTPTAGAWTAAYALTMLAMWWVMMVAMMLPAAAPMILVFGQIARRTGGAGTAALSVWLGAGYCLAWLAFSVLVTGLQYLLEQMGWLHGMLMWSLDVWLSVGLLAAAGLYQLTSFKQACLIRCRTPFDFIRQHFRPGATGAFRMGLVHGAYCVGCCWFLMALLFVGGVMNIVGSPGWR